MQPLVRSIPKRAQLPLSAPVRAPLRRTADALIDVLAEAGVEVVFGLPGGAISPLHDALLDRPDIRVVTTRHEAGAMFAAAGYARTTGRIGVVLVTSGPGALNAVTGLASAWCDGLPVLLIAGEVPRRIAGKGALQDGTSHNLNLVGMVSHITKMAAEIPDAQVAPSMLSRAISTAMSGRRGPVCLTLPIDVSTTEIRPPELALEVSTQFMLRPAALDRAAAALLEARRPLLFAGSGVRHDLGPELLRVFAERRGVPVMTTPKGKGVFPEDHPLSLGVFGMGGHPSAQAYVDEGVDLLIAVGTSLGDLQTDGWTQLVDKEGTFIQVDIDVRQIGRAYPVDLGLVAPAGDFFAQMLTRLPPSRRTEPLGARYHTDPAALGDGEEGLILPQRALWEIQQRLPADTIYAIDSGEHFVFATHYLVTRHPDAFIAMTGLGSMGSSIGAAMGAKLGRPDRAVAVIMGDGGFAMVGTEVATAVAERLPIVIFVMNDRRYGMVEIGHERVYGRRAVYSMQPLDVCRLAEGLGARALRIEHAGQLLETDLLALAADGPLVVDVCIDSREHMPKKDRIQAIGKAPALRVFDSADRGRGQEPSP